MQKSGAVRLVTFWVASTFAFAVQAANYAWLANPASGAWDTATANWDYGAWVNGAGNAAIFGASSIRDITLSGAMDASAVTVSGADYTFTGGQLTLNGPFTVGSGNSADVYSALAQTSAASSERFMKAGDGTLTLHCTAGATNTVYRFKQDGGTMVLDGGTLYVNGTSSSPVDANTTGAFTGGTVVFNNDATLAFAPTTFIACNGGSFMVTNGTLDFSQATELLHGFQDNGGNTPSIMTIQDNGTVKTKIFRISQDQRPAAVNTDIINVNTGGTLRLTRFSIDESSKGRFYGTVNFNGGTVVPTSTTAATDFFGTSAQSNQWKDIYLNICEGGLYLRNEGSAQWLRDELRSGAEHDGGFHLSGGSTVYLMATNSYNGGTYLSTERTGVISTLAIFSDRSLGAVPAEPTNNIFFTSCYSLLHGGNSLEVDRNREILVSSNCVARLGTFNNKVMRIRGALSCEGDPQMANTVLNVHSDWPGKTILDPGDDTTNYPGRMIVHGNLEIASGTFLPTATNITQTGENALLYVSANMSTYTNVGTLTISGGKILVDYNNRYLETARYGQLNITGGLLSIPRLEFLNGLDGPGRTTVSGTGVLDCYSLRISQANVLPYETTSVNVCTGGVITLVRFNVDEKYPVYNRGVVNFNGGTVIAKATRTDFLGTDNLTWRTNVFCYVKEGGAIVSTDYELTIKNSLYSGAEHDGGLTKKGTGALILLNTNTYNGVTTVQQGTLCLRWPCNCLPPTNTVAICAGAVCHTYLASGAIGTQTLARVEGAGTFMYTDNLAVTDSIAPGDGTNGIGTLTFTKACKLSGNLEIDGNETASDCLVVSGDKQDISGLSVTLKDPSKLNKKKVYTIFSAPGGFTGQFTPKFGKSSWILKHDANAKKVYLVYNAGTVVMLMR